MQIQFMYSMFLKVFPNVRSHLRAVIKCLRKAGARDVRIEYGGKHPVATTVGSTKNPFMCCRIAPATPIARSATLSATSAAFSAVGGDHVVELWYGRRSRKSGPHIQEILFFKIDIKYF